VREISIIVPFYNAERYIRECIAGLLTQDYPAAAYEIIMVDNNSTDASVEIVREHPRVILLSEQKQGAYAARNRGLMKAEGAIVAFTDADCVPAQDWLRNIAATMRPPEVQLIIGSRSMGRRSLGLALLAAHEHQQIAFIFARRLHELYYGHTNNMAVRREVFNRVGFFVERRRGADQVLVHRVVGEYSCDAVRYEAQVRVCHKELASFWKYCQKQWIYGRSNRQCREIIASRPLTRWERWEIFRNTVQSEHYVLPHTVLLLLLTTLSGTCYSLGRWFTREGTPRETLSALTDNNGPCQSGRA
jgi:glycosyltransferase involved in cell wall biosynthesis